MSKIQNRQQPKTNNENQKGQSIPRPTSQLSNNNPKKKFIELPKFLLVESFNADEILKRMNENIRDYILLMPEKYIEHSIQVFFDHL